MKMYLGDTQVKNLMLHTDSDDATLVASDLQAGVTAYARGQKVTGTGKCFEFANYGSIFSNVATIVPTVINVIEIASLDYPLQSSIELKDMKDIDFSISQTIGTVIIDGANYPMTAVVSNGKITISCDKTIKLQIFYGKDLHV